jgi:hypothetical protein
MVSPGYTKGGVALAGAHGVVIDVAWSHAPTGVVAQVSANSLLTCDSSVMKCSASGVTAVPAVTA